MKSASALLLKKLTESQIYRGYERAFTAGTGLPLRLHEPEMMQVVRYAQKKAATGINFVDDVARARVEKARILLRNPKLRSGETVHEVGFRSLSQFNRAFRRVTGKAPREYRARLGDVV